MLHGGVDAVDMQFAQVQGIVVIAVHCGPACACSRCCVIGMNAYTDAEKQDSPAHYAAHTQLPDFWSMCWVVCLNSNACTDAEKQDAINLFSMRPVPAASSS
jgi:hypothetical protein